MTDVVGTGRVPFMWRSPVFVAIASVFVLTLLGWIVLAREAIGKGDGAGAFLDALCSPASVLAATGTADFALALLTSIWMWVAMSMAMMLPTALGVMTSFAERVETDGMAAAGPSPLFPLGGYVFVWTVVSALFATGQVSLGWLIATLPLPEPAWTVLAGLIVSLVGLYQFSPLKQTCLILARQPERDRPGQSHGARMSRSRSDAFRFGVEHGIRCVGCCGGLMLALAALGMMNLLWMLIFAGLMAAEKMSRGHLLPRLIGVALVLSGAALSFSAAGVDVLVNRLL